MTNTLFIDAGWKRWIAENTLRGRPPEELAKILVEHGFDEAHARLEVDTARGHPYVAAASSVVRQLSKRDWVLHTERMLQESGPSPVAEEWNSIDLHQFQQYHYGANRPLVIRGGARSWPAIEKWTPEYLTSVAGDREVEIQANRDSDSQYEIDNLKHRQTCKFGEFVEKVFEGGETNDYYMTANNSDINGRALADFWNDVRPLPETLDESTADGRMFFWMGPKGTVTPLHHDLTNNLMVMIAGRKRLKLVAPQYLPFIYNHVHCYSRVDVENIDYERYPLFRNVKVIDVTIGPGDILFLPVGWWHHVRGLDPTITITCTNFKGVNKFTDHYHTHGEI